MELMNSISESAKPCIGERADSLGYFFIKQMTEVGTSSSGSRVMGYTCRDVEGMLCLHTPRSPYYRTLALLRPLRCYAPPPPPPLQREVTAKGHFLLPYTPPHLHMHTCVWLALTSMFTLVLRCYYVVIFAKCVRLFPCGSLRTCGTGL